MATWQEDRRLRDEEALVTIQVTMTFIDIDYTLFIHLFMIMIIDIDCSAGLLFFLLLIKLDIAALRIILELQEVHLPLFLATNGRGLPAWISWYKMQEESPA